MPRHHFQLFFWLFSLAILCVSAEYVIVDQHNQVIKRQSDVNTLDIRATTASTTGCTCYGLQYQQSNIDNDAFHIALWPQNGHNGIVYPNPTGWCFVSGVMQPFWQNQIATALAGTVSTNYVNTTWAKQDCTGSKYTNCTSGIISSFTTLVVPTYLTACTYPTSNFVPTDCGCGFNCTNGYVKCGTSSCINPATQSCVSGVAKNLRRNVPACPMGFDLCPTKSQGWECLDVNSDIEACGACPGVDGAEDCTAIPNVGDVSCRRGRCVVTSCERGYSLLNGRCIKPKSGPQRVIVF